VGQSSLGVESDLVGSSKIESGGGYDAPDRGTRRLAPAMVVNKAGKIFSRRAT
jgi:hypothetical protein